MLADFIITVHDENQPRAVQVKVYETVAAMRGAVTRYDRPTKKKRQRKTDENKFLGICHRFELMKFRRGSQSPEEVNPLCAIVRLAHPHLGIGIVSHELAHAAVWIREQSEGSTGPTPLTCENDEWFCWVLGELIQHTTNKLIEKGVYEQ